MSVKQPPRLDPSEWASARDAKIKLARELREQRRGDEGGAANPLHGNGPAPPPSGSAPPSPRASEARPAENSRYNKAPHGGFTFGDKNKPWEPPPVQPVAPSSPRGGQAPGDENEV